MQENFDFETAKVIGAINSRKCGKVLLQFPEGLKRCAPTIAAAISEATDATVVISGEPCFGACDIPTTDADLIVHFGHLPIPCLETPNSVMYIQARSSADPLPVLEKALPMLGKSVGLLTTVQHLHALNGMMDFLKGEGVRVFVGKGDARLHAEGQVLGCNASCAKAVSARVDSFLFVGTGDFHAIAVALSTSKPVFVADPVAGEVRTVDEAKDRLLRQRHAAIERAGDAKRFGIIVSRKPGQRREALASEMRELLSGAGFETTLVEMDLVTPDKLMAFGLDAWVSTACPRLAIDDRGAYPVPILTPPEAEILVGKRPWDAYIFDEIR